MQSTRSLAPPNTEPRRGQGKSSLFVEATVETTQILDFSPPFLAIYGG